MTHPPTPPSPETPETPATPETPNQPERPAGPQTPAPEARAPEAPRQKNHTLRFTARTDAGLLRSNNEDSYTIGSRLLAVADGMGGHAAGEVASRLVTDALAPLNAGPLPTDMISALDDAIRNGNRAIAQLVARHPELEGMGTTVTALLFDGDHVALAHVGDSRGYLYRSGVLQQLTHDDTFVQSLVDEGRITEQQAHEHPQRNLVLRALTGIPVEPLLTARETAVGDRFLLCSDGLCGVVGAEAIADALAYRDPEVAADTLIDLALAAGGPDNVTVVVVDVLSTGDDPQDTAPMAALPPEDPGATSPIAQLTREMPRVPLPPIPEEPGAAAEIVGGATDLEDDDEATAEDGAAPEQGDDADDASEPRGRGRSKTTGKRRWYLRGAVLITAVIVLAAAAVASTIWVRTQYYVSDQGNLVVVFRGVDGSLLGWDFSTFEETSCAGETDCTPLKVSDLQPAARNQVHAGIKASNLSDARTVVLRLSEQLLPPCPVPLNPPAPPTDIQPTETQPTEQPSTVPSTSTTQPPATTATTATTPRTSTTTASETATGDAPAGAGSAVSIPSHAQLGSGMTTIGPRPTGTRPPDSIMAPPPGTQETPGNQEAAGAQDALGARENPGVQGSLGTQDLPSSVEPTDLAPATQVPGVTCRTVT